MLLDVAFDEWRELQEDLRVPEMATLDLQRAEQAPVVGHRVEAVLHPYAEPRRITVNTVIEGFTQNPVAPGTVTFAIDGVEYELEPALAGDSLFFVFGDQTNRGETYGAGRYLYAAMPGEDGRFVLDFNKAYSPPCAFNDFSTCPVASPRNRLPIRIEVGEKYDKALHFSPDH